MGEDRPAPTRGQVRRVLSELADGRLTPVEASDWAGRWFGEEVDDDLVHETIAALYSADMPIAPGEYLYGPLDFRAWLDDFDAQPNAI